MDAKHLHAAIAAHMAHGAMSQADPMTDALCSLVDEACATEGAWPAGPVSAGLTAEQIARLADAEQDPLLDVLLPLGVTLGAVVSAAVHCLPGLKGLL